MQRESVLLSLAIYYIYFYIVYKPHYITFENNFLNILPYPPPKKEGGGQEKIVPNSVNCNCVLYFSHNHCFGNIGACKKLL